MNACCSRLSRQSCRIGRFVPDLFSLLKAVMIVTVATALRTPMIVASSDSTSGGNASSSSKGASSIQARTDHDHSGTFAQAITIAAADDGPPAIASPIASQIGANQVTLTFQADQDATGYFTLIPGAAAASGTGAQVAAGNNNLGTPAFRRGSLLLKAGLPRNYTVRNLPGSSPFTVAFTASDGTYLQDTPASTSFATTAPASMVGSSWRLPENAPASDEPSDSWRLDFAPDGTPYVAYQVTTLNDGISSSTISMNRFVDGSWQRVGGSIPSSSDLWSLAFAFGPDGDPYLAYRDPAVGGAISVLRHTQEGWNLVGGRGIGSGLADNLRLAFGPDGKPYLAYCELPSRNSAHVRKYDGSSWQEIGSTNSTSFSISELAFAIGFDGNPNLAYLETTGSAHLRRFANGVWDDLPPAPLSTAVESLDLAIAPDGTTTVATPWEVLQLISGEWRRLPFGTDFFRYRQIRVALLPDATPAIFFYDHPTRQQGWLGAREYRNGEWASLGIGLWGSGPPISPSIAPDGTPWVACPTQGNAGRATVYAMMRGPRLARIDRPANGVYGPGDILEFKVVFNEPVTFTGTPTLTFTVGETEMHAACVGGDSTDSLIFRLTVSNPMNDPDGIVCAPFISENSGTIVSASRGERANSQLSDGLLTYPDILVDTTAPSYTGPTQASGYVGRALDQFVTSDEPDVTFSASGLPPGLTMDAAGRLVGTPTATGSYSITIYIIDLGGNQSTAQTTLTIEQFPRIVNISARAHAGTGDDIIIAGFVVTGNDPLPILARAVGPGLLPMGVNAPLANPRLVLYRGNDRIYANDDWQQADASALAEHMARLGAFGLSSRDAAVLVSLPPGAYTMHVLASEYEGTPDIEGVALAEIYDASDTPSPGVNRLVNISSRARVSRGENVEIGGFVVTGGQRRVLIRGVGPGLQKHGVSAFAADPILHLYRGDELIATNDDWGSQPEASEIIAMSNAVGAFPLETGSKDAVLLVTLPPASYTAHVGAAGESQGGIALAEIYELPE